MIFDSMYINLNDVSFVGKIIETEVYDRTVKTGRFSPKRIYKPLFYFDVVFNCGERQGFRSFVKTEINEQRDSLIKALEEGVKK